MRASAYRSRHICPPLIFNAGDSFWIILFPVLIIFPLTHRAYLNDASGIRPAGALLSFLLQRQTGTVFPCFPKIHASLHRVDKSVLAPLD